MSNNNPVSGNPILPARPNAQAMRMKPLLIMMILMVVIFMFMDSELSNIPIIIIIMILPFIIVIIGKKVQIQGQTVSSKDTKRLSWWNSPSQMDTQSINQSSPPPQGGIDQNLDEKRTMVLNITQGFSKIISYVVIPIFLIILLVTILTLGFSNDADYSFYFGIIFSILFVPIVLIFFVKRMLPQFTQRLINDPRSMARTTNNHLGYTQKPDTSTFENQPNPLLNKQSYLNNARADSFTKEGAKIQQHCPFCGKEFFGKRDSCPKCKKII